MYDYNSFYGLFEGMATAFVFILVLVFAFSVITIIANWKMYKKAGKVDGNALYQFMGIGC